MPVRAKKNTTNTCLHGGRVIGHTENPRWEGCRSPSTKRSPPGCRNARLWVRGWGGGGGGMSAGRVRGCVWYVAAATETIIYSQSCPPPGVPDVPASGTPLCVPGTAGSDWLLDLDLDLGIRTATVGEDKADDAGEGVRTRPCVKTLAPALLLQPRSARCCSPWSGLF
eukprot:gene17844-biopygen15938